MYVIRAVKSGLPPRYLADNPSGRRPYRWVAGDDGLRAALRFSSLEAAGEVAHGREFAGAVARVIWDPRSTGREPRRRRRGFVIKAMTSHGASYVAMKDGTFQWQRGRDAEAEAFRFSSVAAAYKIVERGFKGTAGATSEIVEIR